MSHSIIPPSSAAIWGAPDGCRGWVSMNLAYPETEERPEAAEGTATHEIGAALIINAQRANTTPGLASKEWWLDKKASNGVVFTEAMFDGAQLYADDVIDVMRTYGVFGGEYLGVEAHLAAPRIHELSYGTTDCYVYVPSKNKIFIWDFKFGHGIVEAFENWQNINYLAGIVEKFNIDGHLDNLIEVHMRIVQPRAYHRGGAIREWATKLSDIRPYFNVLENSANEALGPPPKFHSGAHCRYCPGRHACPAALEGGVNLYEAATAPMPLELTPDAVGTQLSIIRRAREQLEYLESGYEEQVKSRIRSGAMVSGWALEQGVGRKKWDKPIAEVITLGDMLGIDVRKPPEAITPKQAITLGIDPSVIKQYSTIPRTGLKLVPDDGNKAKEVFSK